MLVWRVAVTPVVVGLLVFAAAGQVWLIARGPKAVETQAIALYEREQSKLAEHAAQRIGARFEEISHRLETLREQRKNGASGALDLKRLLTVARRPWDADGGVVWFIHNAEGRVVELDTQFPEEMRERFMAHVHDDDDGHEHDLGEICVCPMCLEKMSAVSSSLSLGNDLFLTANVDVRVVATRTLNQTIANTQASAWLLNASDEVIQGVGPNHSPLATNAGDVSGQATVPHVGADWRVALSAPRATVAPEVHAEALRIVVVGMLVLVLIVVALAIFLRRVRLMSRDMLARDAALSEAKGEHRTTELALLESQKQLQVAAKMEAIGRLAGGIAHDFNNMLSVILTYATFIEQDGEPGEAADAAEIVVAAERAADLTGQLLAFSRKQVLKPTVLDANAVVEEVKRMLRRLIGEDISIRCRLEADPGLAWFDKGQLVQVVMNLAVNARDAMPEGGNVVVATRNVDIDRTRADELKVEAGSYVQLAFSDDGCGMDEATLSQIFEPFFTTKEPGQGTGLGLATVHGILRQSGGSITVKSTPGAGTAFEVLMPIAREHAASSTRDSSEKRRKRGCETILVVEDEPAVRKLVARSLERHGYHVIVASTARVALDEIRQCRGTIDLLLTDVVMPKMSGRELVEQVRADQPHMLVLFMTGYTDTAIIAHGVSDDAFDIVRKPIQPDSLARSVRLALDAPRPLESSVA